LDKKDDFEIWLFAKKQRFTIVTQDADFNDLGLVKGFPPKIIWFRCGNTSTDNMEDILISNFSIIKNFIKQLPQHCLELF